jgi:polar amino acid transport system substrate-binding protein
MPHDRLSRRALLGTLPLLTTAPARAAPDGSLRRVLEAGVVRIGVQVEGTRAATRLSDGRLWGYLPELGRRIASGLGVRAEFIAVPRGGMLGLVMSDRFDLGLGGAIASTWVALTALLSDPIMEFQLVAMTRQDLDVRVMADLRGLRVAVIEGRSFAEAVREAGVDKESLVTASNWESAAEALIGGQHQAIIVPSYHATEIQEVAPQITQRFTLGNFAHCGVIRMGQHDLLRALNILFYLMRQEGEMEALHQAFFGRGLTMRRTL